MAYPNVERLELPILQELVATGGVEEVRFLYARLVAYFPQLEGAEIHARSNGHHQTSWRRLVQRAGRTLDEKRQLERERGRWTITHAGRHRATEEETQFSFTDNAAQAEQVAPLSHTDVQQMLLDIGRILGHHAQSEFEYYDVVWRASEASPRLSHVFEVQHKGNIDSALAKLKHAYDAQRSKPFLVVASERDTNRAQKHLSQARTGAFHEIGRVTAILSFEQLRRLHRALASVEDLLAQIFE